MKYLSLLFLTALLFTSCDELFDNEEHVEIPEAIQTFITNNFPDFTADEAEMKTLCDGTAVLEVEIENADDAEMELVFDSENSLIFVESDIQESDLPATVTAKIISDYATYEIREAERLDFMNDDIQFEVELKDGSSKLEVIFAADGTVLCEQEDHD